MYRTDASPDRTLLISAFLGKVFGVDRATGEIRWKAVLESHGCVELAVGDGIVVALTSQKLAFFDYATGRALRVVERKDDAMSGRATMLFDSGQLLVAGYGAVACYTLQGDLVWKQPFVGESYGELAMGFPGNVRQADDRG
jgi:hypothetical protein